jgi:hypothetical protein
MERPSGARRSQAPLTQLQQTLNAQEISPLPALWPEGKKAPRRPKEDARRSPLAGARASPKLRRISQILGVTPAMEAGIAEQVWSLQEIVNLTD